MSTIINNLQTQLVPVREKPDWDKIAQEGWNKIASIVNAAIGVRVLANLVLDYYGTAITQLNLKTSFLKARKLYGLFIQPNQYLLVEWRSNALISVKNVKGIKEISFKSPKTTTPVLRIEEQGMPQQLLLMRYETKFGPTKKKILQVPHLILDSRRSYCISFIPEALANRIEFWEITGPTIADRTFINAQTCNDQPIVPSSSLLPPPSVDETDEKDRDNLSTDNISPAPLRLSSDPIAAIGSEIERLCGRDPREFAILFSNYVSQQFGRSSAQLLSDLRKQEK